MKTSGKLTSHLWPKKTALTHLKRDSHSCNVWFLITGHRSVFQPFFTWPGSTCLLVDEVAEERPGLVASAQRHDAQPWPGMGRFLGAGRAWETGDVQPVECWTISGWWCTYPSEKWWSSSVGTIIPDIWKNKKCSNPPTSICLLALTAEDMVLKTTKDYILETYRVPGKGFQLHFKHGEKIALKSHLTAQVKHDFTWLVKT